MLQTKFSFFLLMLTTAMLLDHVESFSWPRIPPMGLFPWVSSPDTIANEIKAQVANTETQIDKVKDKVAEYTKNNPGGVIRKVVESPDGTTKEVITSYVSPDGKTQSFAQASRTVSPNNNSRSFSDSRKTYSSWSSP